MISNAIYREWEGKIKLREQLLGKTPRQAAIIIADEFTRQFGIFVGSALIIKNKLISCHNNALGWNILQQNIHRLIADNHSQWQLQQTILDYNKASAPAYFKRNEIGAEVNFWETILTIIDSLPQKKDYKLSNRKRDKITPEHLAMNFVTCRFCWRAVLRWPCTKRTPTCHVHDIESTDPVMPPKISSL